MGDATRKKYHSLPTSRRKLKDVLPPFQSSLPFGRRHHTLPTFPSWLSPCSPCRLLLLRLITESSLSVNRVRRS
jgi:hypothetical protein